ncbi:PD-(D/E)XK nuclease family protein [Oscillibacter sp.]|uniref:PD-(D/E)XK nuclease family protein n=1 Tax=Oscillibacter sp. TaxID=1945593 RepID=UPI00338F492F
MFQVSLRTRDQLTRLADQAGCPWEVRTLTSADDSALGYLEHHFFGEGEPYQGDSSAIRVREADTAFSEVEQTAADIRRLVAAGKCRYRDITVAARNMTDYEGTIETVFERYSIPAYLSRRSSMLEKPVWSLITGVLSALENGLEYEDMFRWLKTGLAGLMPEECDELENYVLTWEIHGKMWLRDVDWTDNPDGYGAPWDKRRQARLDRVNELRRRVRAPLAELYEGLKAGVTAGEKVNSLYSFLEHLNLKNALEEQMRPRRRQGVSRTRRRPPSCGRSSAPSWTSLWRSWGTSLWGPMNSAACCGRWPPSTAWALSPCLWTRCPSRKSPEMTVTRMPTCFCWGPMTTCCPLWDRAAAFSTTMTGRNWPSGASAWRPAAWNRWALSSRTSTPLWFSPGGLVVSYPTADVSGAELRPAFVVDRLLTLFPELRIEHEGTDKVYRLTARIPALETAGTAPGGILWRYFADDEVLAPPMAAMERAAALKRGSLSRSAVQALYGERISMSASRVERLRSCHFAYFMEYGLKAKARRAAAFDAPQIGTFLHYLLEHVTKDVLDRGGFAAVGEEDLHALVRRYIEQYAAEVLKIWRAGTPGSGTSSPGCGTPLTRWWTSSPRRCAAPTSCPWPSSCPSASAENCRR